MKRPFRFIIGVVVVALLAALALYNDPVARQRRAFRPPPLSGGSEFDNRAIGEEDLERLYPHTVLRTGKGRGKTVALTFDDGPDKTYTPAVLDILSKKGVKATFFLIGERIQEEPDMVKRIVSDGHLIGNHTYSHPGLLKEGSGLRDELSRTESALKRFGVTTNTLFRPPYGAVNPSLVVEASNLGYRLALWSVDSLDWRGLSSAEVVRNIVDYVTPGAVILQHSAGGPGEDLSGSVAALPGIIDDLQAKGYRFVTLAEMFDLTGADR